MAQASLTVRRTCQAGAKAEHSEPTVRIRRGRRLSDKSYPRDNRLVVSKSSYRRHCSAPRCRLNLSWGCRSSQGFGCSPIKKLRELGSDRLEENSKFEYRNSKQLTFLCHPREGGEPDFPRFPPLRERLRKVVCFALRI